MLLFIYCSCKRAVQVLHTLVSALRSSGGCSPRVLDPDSIGTVWDMGNGDDSEGLGSVVVADHQPAVLSLKDGLY